MKTDTPSLVDNSQTIAKTGLVHRVWQPSDDSAPHPTIIMNHGRSGNEDVTWIFSNLLPKEWLIISPRAHLQDPRGGNSWDVNLNGQLPELCDLDPAVDKMHTFIHALPDLYNADLSRLHFLGFSQGGALTIALKLAYPDLVQSHAHLVSFIPRECDKSANFAHLADFPIFMASGRKDETIPLSEAKKCAQLLITAGARLNYREYNTGHKMNAQGMRDLGSWFQSIQ